MLIRWEEGFAITTGTCDGVVSISANRAGLLSLANILTDLANEEPGAHIHLDENNSLEDGSAELVISLV